MAQGILRAIELKTDIPDQETRLMCAVSVPQSVPSITIVQSDKDTKDLVEQALAQFMQVHQSLPSIICLNAFRYLTYGMLQKNYRFQEKDIPYVYEEGGSYEIMVWGTYA